MAKKKASAEKKAAAKNKVSVSDILAGSLGNKEKIEAISAMDVSADIKAVLQSGLKNERRLLGISKLV